MARRYAHEGEVIVEQESGLPYFLLGLGLGVAVGVLFAPQSGAETRRLLKDKAEEGADLVRRRASEFQETAAEALERSKQSLQRRKETLSAAVEAGRQAYREAATEND
jgi:gas vesicle protein